MEHSADHEHGKSLRKSWMIVFGIASAFLIWGFTIYFAVGDKGPPRWDYSVIEDVPGQSPYSTLRTKDFSGLIPKPMHSIDVPEQHVNEPPKKPESVQQTPGR
jgi:hypothetical protein